MDLLRLNLLRKATIARTIAKSNYCEKSQKYSCSTRLLDPGTRLGPLQRSKVQSAAIWWNGLDGDSGEGDGQMLR